MIPLGHIRASYVRSHFSTAELTVWDAPRRDEIVFGLSVANGGRPHARAGGLAAEHVVGLDGLRRSEEHTSELQSLMRISYAVFCLKKKKKNKRTKPRNRHRQHKTSTQRH